ncbi:putative protease [Sinobacterium caligoides]|uniref:Putative protease n=1 Tax=Sinobacterium caligoides TaxID=933926 RepID=A0A3N2DRW2_9GAMM|nr:peptidase U32 family protein [Sinobacterium caligoides]ROS02045.1 putative protease [Sinobacterium caligoides]
MSRKIELLAPGGDVEAIKAAIVAGANAVYCGLDTFNARNRAANLSFDELAGVLRLARQYQCEVFLTVNVVILEQELKALFKLLSQLVNLGIDGIIVQDLALFTLVKKYFPTLDIHASTQLTTHNEGQLPLLAKLGASRVNLSRELNLAEVESMTAVAHQHNLLTEVFVHGSLCIAFSGQCYSSSVSVGNSGNRGRCSQACRDEYEETAAGNKFPLNLKDNSAYFDLPELVAAGVDSLKIEGRIKGAHYVYTVVDSWRQQMNSFVERGELLADDSNLHKVFNRDFTNSFLKGNLTKDMFIDNPRDYSVQHAIDSSDAISVVQIQEVKQELYADRNALGDELAEKIQSLHIDKLPLQIHFIGTAEQPLVIEVISGDQRFTLQSESVLATSERPNITAPQLEKRFKNISPWHHDVAPLDFSQLQDNLSLPFQALTTLRSELATWLNDGRPQLPAVELPVLERHPKLSDKPTLSLLISDVKDLHLCDVTDADIYFKLPESFKKGCRKFIDILQANPRLIPWFPAVLIGKDYIEAVNILEQVRPSRIVSNNTGVAYKATSLGIEWIAGPLLNTTNSFTLQTLQEEMGCSGAFISNEINRLQMRNIARPKNFKLLYSIYHPILMMTSRQCFFQQTVGCKKPSIEDGCMLKCEKATTITNVKGVSFAVDKQKGGYPSIYNDEQFLNVEVVADLAELYDEFFIDLTNIGAGSKAEQDKVQLIQHFEGLLAGVEGAAEALHEQVTVSTNAQYRQGL